MRQSNDTRWTCSKQPTLLVRILCRRILCSCTCARIPPRDDASAQYDALLPPASLLQRLQGLEQRKLGLVAQLHLLQVSVIAAAEAAYA